MSTPDSTPPDYAGLSKQEVAERLKNPTPGATSPGANETRKIFVSETPTTATLTIQAKPTPDATATPRTDADKLATELIVWSSLPLGAGINQYEFSRVAREAAKLLRELTAAKAQLRERTQWQCACGGTDCAGQAENERLRVEVERLKELNIRCAKDGIAHAKRAEAAEAEVERWRSGDYKSATYQNVLKLEKERNGFSDEVTALANDVTQLRARVADLESQLAASATKAAAEYGEQLKPLFAKVRELEQENTRLTELLRNRLVEVQEQQQGGITT